LVHILNFYLIKYNKKTLPNKRQLYLSLDNPHGIPYSTQKMPSPQVEVFWMALGKIDPLAPPPLSLQTQM